MKIFQTTFIQQITFGQEFFVLFYEGENCILKKVFEGFFLQNFQFLKSFAKIYWFGPDNTRYI